VAILNCRHGWGTVQSKVGRNWLVVTCGDAGMASYTLTLHMTDERGQGLPQHAVAIRRFSFLLASQVNE
jgi:hypothetical protein